jgi:hypothetical protein
MLDILFVILGAAILAALWIMLYDGNRFVITKYGINDKKISRHYRVVVLADLHNKTYGKNNENLIDAVRGQNPDAILVAGDIPTAKPGKKLDTALGLMESLAKDYPIYYANGNHEHRMELYPEKYGDMAEKYEAGLKCAGVDRLVNSHCALDKENIVIYGSQIDKIYYKRFKIQPMEKNYLGSILGQPNKDRYNILIAHNPDYFPYYADWGADLVLSGHIHGGMVRIPFINKGVVSPNVSFFPKYDAGMYREKESTMILSRGLGMHTIPIRLFNPAELITIDFDRQEK